MRPGGTIRAGSVGDLIEIDGSRAGGAGEGGAGTFDGDLRTLRGRVLRSWALAAAVRCAVLALGVAVVPAVLAATGTIGRPWTLAVGVGAFLLALGVSLRQPPSPAQVARLLDDRLGLFDVTATALQLERSGEPIDEGPAAPVFAEAAALLHAGASSWRVRPKLGARELGAGVGLAAILVALLLIGGGSSGGVARRPTAAVEHHHGNHKVSGNVASPPLAPPRAKHHPAEEQPNGQEKRSPLGLYDFGNEGRKALPRAEQKRAPGLYSHRGAEGSPGDQPQSFGEKSPVESSEAREKAEEEAATSAAKQEASQEEPKGSAGAQSLKSLTGGKAPPTGSVAPLPSSGANNGAAKSSPTSPGSGSNGGRPSAGASGSQGGGGAPSGGGSAGHQSASLGNHGEGAEGGKAGGELSLKAGFAASRGGKAATGHGPRDAQGGGGPGRSAGIGGTAFEEGSSGALGYVPPDAGVAPGVDEGLFARYLDALGQVGELGW